MFDAISSSFVNKMTKFFFFLIQNVILEHTETAVLKDGTRRNTPDGIRRAEARYHLSGTIAASSPGRPA